MSGRILTYLQGNKISVVCACFSAIWCLSALLVVIVFPHFFEDVNAKFYDWKMSLRPLGSLSSEIVHLDIDDSAISQFGEWQWDRALSAQIVNKLSEFGAKVVVFDILYLSVGKSKEGNEAFFDAIRRAGNVVLATGFGGLTQRNVEKLEPPQERSRADALHDKAWVFIVPPQLNLLRVSELRNSSLPLLPIIEYANGIGFITATPDRDGVYRKVPLLVRLADRCVPSLSLSTLMAYWNLPPDAIVLDRKRHVEIKRASEMMRIPIDAHGMIRIH